MHVDDPKNNYKLLILSETKTKTKTSFEFTTINCEAPPSVKGLTLARRPLPLFEGITPGSIFILASFHGLVCLGISSIDGYLYSNLILWNPLTNEYKRLSKFNSHKECNDIWSIYSYFGLYYNCCEDDYKLLFVNFVDKDYYIYSLKSDSWRKVDVFQHISIRYPGSWSRGTYLNENLYFLQEDMSGRLYSIIKFDTKTERFSEIETHHVDDNPDAYDYYATIVVKGDCIHVCVKYDTDISYDSGFGSMTCIKLWKLDEYGKLIEVVDYQLRMPVYDIHLGSLIPLYLMKNENWVMCSYENHQICKVDLKKKINIKDKGEGKEKGSIVDDFEYVKVSVGDDMNIVDEEREVVGELKKASYGGTVSQELVMVPKFSEEIDKRQGPSSIQKKSSLLMREDESHDPEYSGSVQSLDLIDHHSNFEAVIKVQQKMPDDVIPDTLSFGVSFEINRKKLQNIEHLVQKLIRLNSTHDEAHIDYIASLCENIKPDDRKLIFDNVNKVLAKKLALVVPSLETFSSKYLKLANKTLNGQKLLRDLCMEIEELLQVKKKKEDTDYDSELPVIALEVERLIFKDLVNEVVLGEASHGSLCVWLPMTPVLVPSPLNNDCVATAGTLLSSPILGGVDVLGILMVAVKSNDSLVPSRMAR
uniref:Uncharacterized protein n=1 Tax=Tanacetum cinerariifolium TaxID=118510 RepID=A0A6L2JYI4_TANCI|nr:hypothetical protein [Tanacetum cinerariifolium]